MTGKRYMVAFKQSGEGCDYTVGCGLYMAEVTATGPESALREVIRKQFGEINPDDATREFTWIKVYEIASDDAGASWAEYAAEQRAAISDAKANEERRRDEAELERLRKKLGK